MANPAGGIPSVPRVFAHSEPAEEGALSHLVLWLHFSKHTQLGRLFCCVLFLRGWAGDKNSLIVTVSAGETPKSELVRFPRVSVRGLLLLGIINYTCSG